MLSHNVVNNYCNYINTHTHTHSMWRLKIADSGHVFCNHHIHAKSDGGMHNSLPLDNYEAFFLATTVGLIAGPQHTLRHTANTPCRARLTWIIAIACEKSTVHRERERERKKPRWTMCDVRSVYWCRVMLCFVESSMIAIDWKEKRKNVKRS